MNPKMKGLQITLASLTMATTVLSLAGFAALAPVTALAVTPADYGLHEGQTISADGNPNDANYDPDIYIVNDWGYKRLFLNPVIFNFYGHLGGFGAVTKVSATARDAFGTSGLFRNCETNDPKVYAVQVTSEDGGVLHWLNESGSAAAAEDANFFKKVFCINNNEFNWYPKGSDYTSVSQVPNYSRTGATPPPSGGVSASLSSDNPAAATLIAGQAIADLAHFTFSGNGSVTNLVLQRVGVSSDTTLTNVYLYMGAKRLTDAAAVSNSKITFNDPAGLFSVAGSANISVRADVATGTSGQTVGVQLTSFNSNNVSLQGNLFTIATTPSDFGTLAMNSTTTPSAGTIDPQKDFIMWQNTVTVGNHDLWLKSLQLRVIGSVNVGDLQNFRLYVDGVQVGSALAQTDANGYLVFDLSTSPYTLRTGSRIFKLVGDVIGGSSRNFTVSLRQKPDIYAVESQYGQPVLASGTFPVAAGQQTIASGSLTVTKTSDSPSGDIVKDTSGAVLARYKLEAFGERMKVENLRAAVHFSGAGSAFELRNGGIFVDGSQVGSTANLCSSDDTSCSGFVAASSVSYTQYNTGSSLIVVPGTPRYVEIRADVHDNDATDDVAANTTIQALFQAGSSNVQRLTTLDFVSVPNATTVTGNALTVKTGSFTAQKYTGYANQSVTVPKSAFKIGQYTLAVTSSEDVNVNQIDISVDPSGTFTAAKLSNVYLKVWNDMGTMILQSTPKSTVTAAPSSNSYSVNFTIPHSKTYQVEVWSDIASGITAGHSLNTRLAALGTTAQSSTTADTSPEVVGQTITAQSAVLTLANGSIPADRNAQGGTTVTTYSFTLQPQYDDFFLDEAAFNLSSSVASSTGAVAMVYLKQGTTVIASAPMNGGASVSTMFLAPSYQVTQGGGTKTFTVDVQLSNVGVGANDTGGVVLVRLSHLKYHDSNGNVTTSVVAPTSFAGNSNYVFATYPVITNQSLPSTVLAAGTQTLFKTKAASVTGNVDFKKVVFTIQKTANPVIDETSYKLYEDGVNVTSLGTFATASADLTTTSALTGTVSFVFTNPRTLDSTGHVYELRADISGTLVAGHSISTKINASSTASTTEDYATVAGASPTASFVWSDRSSAAHTVSTDDWMNDYLLQTINVSQSLVL